jgi:hypothetical protein
MNISATYICPVRGLAGLEPTDPERLGQAAKVCRDLGLARLNLPVLEEALLKPAREKVQYLDGLVRALDQLADVKIPAGLIATAQRLLGLEWIPPYLARPVKAPRAPQVFVEKKVRNLLPFAWWQDPTLVQKRIALFRELGAAVSGHPALSTWFIFDRFLEWSRPEPQQADLVLRSFLAEIKERDPHNRIFLNLDWSTLLDPDLVRSLAHQVDGLSLTGLDQFPENLEPSASEFHKAAYLGSLGQWLFQKPIEIETGWSLLRQPYDPEIFIKNGSALALQGISGLNWLTLADPLTRLHTEPPWNLNPDLAKLGLLDQALEPKPGLNSWFKECSSQKARQNLFDFIDISHIEYLKDPQIHFNRLWEHFIDFL